MQAVRTVIDKLAFAEGPRWRDGRCTSDVAETIPVEGHALACVLGGPDRRTLYMALSQELEPGKCLSNPSAAVLAANVAVPGEGRPWASVRGCSIAGKAMSRAAVG